MVSVPQAAALGAISAVRSWLLFPKQSLVGPGPYPSISHQDVSPDFRGQKSLKKNQKNRQSKRALWLRNGVC